MTLNALQIDLLGRLCHINRINHMTIISMAVKRCKLEKTSPGPCSMSPWRYPSIPRLAGTNRCGGKVKADDSLPKYSLEISGQWNLAIQASFNKTLTSRDFGRLGFLEDFFSRLGYHVPCISQDILRPPVESLQI